MSPAKRGPGRPRLPRGQAKGTVLTVRLSAVERKAIEDAATAAGKPPSAWAREVVLAAAAAPRG